MNRLLILIKICCFFFLSFRFFWYIVGAGGIGYAVALQLLQKYKLRVVLLDISESSLATSSKDLLASGIPPTQFSTQVCDVSSYDQLLIIAKSIREKYGSIDFLMLNAGVSHSSGFEGEMEPWIKTLNVNLMGVLNGVQAFVSDMVKQDSEVRIVITVSTFFLLNIHNFDY